jgi:hypothetical protein
VRGVELWPESAIVAPYRVAMFYAVAEGKLAGLLVGSRASDRDEWQPAIDRITVESVVVEGRSLHIGPWQDLIGDTDIGWPLFGYASGRFVVYVRNDESRVRELRAVLVLHGDDGTVRRRRLDSRRLFKPR